MSSPRPRGTKLLVAGDFNINLAEPEGDRRGENIAAAMAIEGLEDMSAHFLLGRRSWCRDGRTWSMIQEGREVRSWTDYIMGTDRRLFGNVSVWDPRHNSYHYMVLGCLHSASSREHNRYLRGCKRLPLRPPTAPTRDDIIFAALWRTVPNPRAQEARKNVWILATTWILVDKRVSARRYIAKYQALIWRLGSAIKASLQEYRKRRAEEERAEVETLLGSYPPLHQEDWHRIKGWYKAVFYRALPPAWVALERITTEREELYSYVPPPGTNIPISVKPFPVDDSVPMEYQIEWSVTRLCNHRSGEPLGVGVEHLKRWMAAAQKAEKDTTTTARAETAENRGDMAMQTAAGPTEVANWTMVVNLVQTAFREGKLAE